MYPKSTPVWVRFPFFNGLDWSSSCCSACLAAWRRMDSCGVSGLRLSVGTDLPIGDPTPGKIKYIYIYIFPIVIDLPLTPKNTYSFQQMEVICHTNGLPQKPRRLGNQHAFRNPAPAPSPPPRPPPSASSTKRSVFGRKSRREEHTADAVAPAPASIMFEPSFLNPQHSLQNGLLPQTYGPVESFVFFNASTPQWLANCRHIDFGQNDVTLCLSDCKSNLLSSITHLYLVQFVQ